MKKARRFYTVVSTSRYDLRAVKEFLQTRRLLVMVLALGLFAIAARGVTDPDVWWHLRTGQLIVTTHRVPPADPYSFTRSGQPWIDHEWLSQVIMFGLYRVAGWGGLIVAFGVLTAAGLLLVFLRCQGRPYTAALLVLWGAYAAAPCWGVRPQVVTFLFASLLLVILDRSYQRPNLLWWIPLLMLLWANLHAGYALGIALLILFVVGDALDLMFGCLEKPQALDRFKRMAATIAMSIAVIPLNPNGIRLYRYPLETLSSRSMHSYIGEWFSPDFHRVMYLPAMFMMLGCVALPALSRRRLRPRELLLLAVTMFGALRSVRHIPVYVLVAVPILSGTLQACLDNYRASRGLKISQLPLTPVRILVNATVLAGVLVFTIVRVHSVVGRQDEAESREFPAAAASYLAETRPAGPILNHYNWGGYFIWKLYPAYRVYIDGRADLYGDAFMDDFACTYHVAGDSWRKPLVEWGIRTVVLPPDAPAVAALRATPGWLPVYSDTQAVILTKAQ